MVYGVNVFREYIFVSYLFKVKFRLDCDCEGVLCYCI